MAGFPSTSSPTESSVLIRAVSGSAPPDRKVAESSPGMRIWVQDLERATLLPITPADVRQPVILADGRFVCARAPDWNWYLYPADGKGEPQRVAGILPGEEPIRPTADGRLYVRGADELRAGRVTHHDTRLPSRSLHRAARSLEGNSSPKSEDGRRNLVHPVFRRRQDLRLHASSVFRRADPGRRAEVDR